MGGAGTGSSAGCSWPGSATWPAPGRRRRRWRRTTSVSRARMSRPEWGERKAVAGLAAATVGAAAVLLLPTPAGLPPEGRRMAALFLVTLILWMTEAIPVAVTALLALALQPIFRVATI